MERRGQVNCYEPESFGPDVHYTINLADGTTPFMKMFDGMIHRSTCYRLRKVIFIEVKHAWYRPNKEVFDGLDHETQDHVLNGGLLCDPMADAMKKQMPNDPVVSSWKYEDFQHFALSYYGRRLPPLPEETHTKL